VDLLRDLYGSCRLLYEYEVRLDLLEGLERGWMLRPDHLFVGPVGVRRLHVLYPVYDGASLQQLCT
jgi:hypothetical protein